MKVKCTKEYDAIQWNGEDLPFIIKGTNFPFINNQTSLPSVFYVKTETETVSIKPGYWILLENSNPKHVITQEIFSRDWRQV